MGTAPMHVVDGVGGRARRAAFARARNLSYSCALFVTWRFLLPLATPAASNMLKNPCVRAESFQRPRGLTTSYGPIL